MGVLGEIINEDHKQDGAQNGPLRDSTYDGHMYYVQSATINNLTMCYISHEQFNPSDLLFMDACPLELVHQVMIIRDFIKGLYGGSVRLVV